MAKASDPGNRRSFGASRPRAVDEFQVTRVHAKRPPQRFQPLPKPTGRAPYHLALGDVLGVEWIQAIESAGKIVFHIVGDTGGVRFPQDQRIVAMHMVDDFARADTSNYPAFLYLLGDDVYYYGAAEEYYPQFYEPYVDYPAPIFAIPGNHDGDVQDPSVSSLAAFVENFCARTAGPTAESNDTGRDAMTQPNVYWTLEAPFVTIVGLYTNVPEGGQLEPKQIRWLESELTNAPTDKALLVTMHHPIYSADAFHGGTQYMGQVLDAAVQKTRRIPDAVLAGHVHNFQRYTRQLEARDVPYIVAGAGGYFNLHYVNRLQSGPVETPFAVAEPGVTLESYCDDRHGYMRLEISPDRMIGQYFTVPRAHESWRSPASRYDRFTLDLKQHRLTL